MLQIKPLLLIALFLYAFKGVSQVGIGTTNPDVSAVLDVASTTQGILTPRMTSSERNAISNPATGLLVYDTDLTMFYFFDGTVWVAMASPTVNKTGWVAMSDGDYSLTLPGISLANSGDPSKFTDIELDFSNDASDSSIDLYAPTGYTASDFFDDSTHRFTPLSVGDAVEVRLQFNAVPDNNNGFLVLTLDIGSPNGIVIFEKTVPLLRGSGQTNKVSESILLYQLGTFLANGAVLRIGYAASTGSAGDVELSNFGLVISRVHSGN